MMLLPPIKQFAVVEVKIWSAPAQLLLLMAPLPEALTGPSMSRISDPVAWTVRPAVTLVDPVPTTVTFLPAVTVVEPIVAPDTK